MRPQRASKLIDLEAAVATVRPGSSICLGGFMIHNRPAAFVRALIRQEIGGLTLYSSPSSSYDTDLLLGSGLVRKAYLANVVFENLGLAPNYRRAWEEGLVEMIECEEATIVGGLMAAVEGLSHHPVASLKGSDILAVSELARTHVQIGGEALLAVAAIRPDVAILHAQQADPYGNVRHLGGDFADLLMAKAARRVIVTVDEVISPDEIQSNPRMTTIPGHLVDAVVEVPYGAHPGSSHGKYRHDEDHLKDYLRAGEATRRGTDADAFPAYLRRYVFEPADHYEYLDRIGGLRRLVQLR
ncbi:MAG TPA: CoA-transferase [Dehalococcoidia bacterium]|nr:CoA-transferase [Dehalococcoidia bacterium]